MTWHRRCLSLLSLLALLALVAATGSCGWPWQQSNPHDEQRCRPACDDGLACLEGTCIRRGMTAADGGGEGAPIPDLPLDRGLDGLRPDLGGDGAGEGPDLNFLLDTHPAPDLGAADLDATLLADTGPDATTPVDAGPDATTPVDAGPDAIPSLPVWAVATGSTSWDHADKVVMDGAGNFFVAGRYKGTVSFTPTTGPAISLISAGLEDAFVAKLNAKGEYLWVTSLGGASTDGAQDLKVDSAGSIYATGIFMGQASFGTYTFNALGLKDIFIAKLDPKGTVLWAAAGGSAGWDNGYGVAVDGAGNVYVGGSVEGKAVFGSLPTTTHHGMLDVVLLKLDAAGTFLWAKTAGGADNDDLLDLVLDAPGHLHAVGGFKGKASFGTLTASAAGIMDIFVTRLDTKGQFSWISAAGGSKWERADHIALDSAGNSHVVGRFEGTASFGTLAKLTSKGDTDVFVTRLDSQGKFTWARRAGGSLFDHALAVALDSSGNVHVTGTFAGIGKADFGPFSLASNGGQDIFAVRLTPAGTFDRLATAGGSGPDWALGVVATSPENVVICGSFANTVLFGSQSLTSKGNIDAYIWRLNYP